MRLTPFEREVIRRATAEIAGPAARVLLFGSRTDAGLRGGDIDLLIELPQPRADRLALGLRIGARIERQLGEQRIDVLVADPASAETPVLTAARRDGIVL